jgi:hypothetical protein
MTTQPAVIGLVGSTATEVAIDSATVHYDGLSRLSWPLSKPNPYDDARLIVASNATQTDATADYKLHDYQAGEDVAVISGAAIDTEQALVKWDPNDLDGTATVGLKVEITSASGTTGATTDIDAKLVLLP